MSIRDMYGTDLSGKYLADFALDNEDLKDFDLSGSYLGRANLSGTNLTNANLANANLANANLSRTNLTNANLTNADLTEVKLTNANLTNANLTNADLSGANLSGANLTNVIGLGTKEGEIEFAQWLLSGIKTGEKGLYMEKWHSDCGTAHCIAGWKYPNKFSPGALASIDLPTLAKYFYASNEEALAALERVANGEESVFN